MQKHYVLISGPTVAVDDELVSMLRESVNVLRCPDNRQVETTIVENKVDLILLEVTGEGLSKIDLIKSNHPDIEVIMIIENPDVMARALKAYNPKNIFRMPYKSQRKLIEERVNIILNGIRCQAFFSKGDK